VSYRSEREGKKRPEPVELDLLGAVVASSASLFRVHKPSTILFWSGQCTPADVGIQKMTSQSPLEKHLNILDIEDQAGQNGTAERLISHLPPHVEDTARLFI
jgi:hypothetical protein